MLAKTGTQDLEKFEGVGSIFFGSRFGRIKKRIFDVKIATEALLAEKQC